MLKHGLCCISRCKGFGCYYKLVIPLYQLSAVNPSTSKTNPSEKYIQIMSDDNHEFWFMGFVHYDNVVQSIQETLLASLFQNRLHLELVYAMEVDEKCDVFSFGVLSLEIIIARHPGDLISSLFSSSTTSKASNSLLKNVLDRRLPHPVMPIVKEVILVAKPTFPCLSQSPPSRPSMEHVYGEFVMPRS
ncbi:unnamed protein product [Lupinus luteus]|uniref:non-specific serine/threonine protein kinase n=1 Tax=Lupinus luteus TaxID=3873 RepID=A0AAV1WTC7_LUPLU